MGILEALEEKKENLRIQLEFYQEASKEIKAAYNNDPALEEEYKQNEISIKRTQSDLELTESFIEIINHFEEMGDSERTMGEKDFARCIFHQALSESTNYFSEVVCDEHQREFFRGKLKTEIEQLSENKRLSTSERGLLDGKIKLSKQLKSFNNDEKERREILHSYQELCQKELSLLLSKSSEEKLKSMKKSDIVMLILNIITLGLYGYFLRIKQKRVESTSKEFNDAFERDAKMPSKMEEFQERLERIREQKESLGGEYHRTLELVTNLFNKAAEEKDFIEQNKLIGRLIGCENFLRNCTDNIKRLESNSLGSEGISI